MNEMVALTNRLKAEDDYAWGWHCNIAMAFYEEGGDIITANKAAARFMQMAFEIDTSQFEEYQHVMSFWGR